MQPGTMINRLCSSILAWALVACWNTGLAQDIPIQDQKSILFPRPMDRKWAVSIGFTATTLPHEITEELHFRMPAGDLHVLRKIHDKFYLDGRLSFQALQNLILLGPHWAKPLNNRFYLSLGNDVAYWFGFIKTEGINTRGHGWQSYPSASIGYRFNKQILLSFKAEGIMNLNVTTYAGNTPVTTDYQLFSGSSYTIALEQPFYGHKSMTLGFRAIYTNFFWQTWTLFEPFDRNLFFPQLIVGIIL